MNPLSRSRNQTEASCPYDFAYMRRLFSRMNCVKCGHQLCDTSDIFNLEKTRNFPFLSPGGVSHEFITVYKIINFHLIDDKPITENTWFQGNLKSVLVF